MGVKDELIKQLGKGKVTSKASDIKKYTQEGGHKPFGAPQCLVYAHSANDIKTVIDIANNHKISIVPSSSAVHFYGPHIPYHSGILLDLTNMDRIENIDKRNRKLKLETGVTWGQAQSTLREHDCMIVSPLLPHRHRSVLTDYLERTPPVIPLFEYGEPLLSMEVVWPTGHIFRTGSASVPKYPNSIAEGTNPQGPAAMDYYRILQGAQGTMGVVSWANIKMEFIPTLDKTFFIHFENLEDATEPIYRIQKRRIGLESLLLNKTNLLKILSTQFGLNPQRLSDNLSSWTLIIILSGFKRRPLEKIQYEEKALEAITSELLLSITEKIPKAMGIEKEIPGLLRNPWEGSSYWKSSDNLQYKDLFFITTLNRIKSFFKVLEHVFPKYEYPMADAGFYVQPIEHGRACHFEVNFYYDRKQRSEDDMRAMFRDVATRFIDMGALFTRPYGELSKWVYKKPYNYTKVLKQVKGVMDPNNIMCAGALCF